MLVLARMLLGDYHRLQAILLLVASAMVAWHYARWPPFYRHQITHIQVRRACWPCNLLSTAGHCQPGKLWCWVCAGS